MGGRIMAWTIKAPSGEKVTPTIPTGQLETYGQQAKRIGTSAGLSALKGLENFFVGIPELLGAALPPGQQRLSQLVEEKAGITPEYLEPQSFPEKALQRFAQSAPLAATLGGLPQAALTGIGSLAGAGAEQLGAPEIVGDIAQLGTELVGGRLKPFKGKVPTIPTVKEAQKAEYDLSKLAVPKNTAAQATDITKATDEVSRLLETETSRKISKEISHTLEQIGQNITREKINPVKAMELRKALYRQSRSLDPSVSVNYIQPLTRGINDFFSVYSAENPLFYKHLKTADKLSELRNMSSYLAGIFDYFKLNKFPGGEAGKAILDKTLGHGERFFRGLLTNSAARKYYFDAIKAASAQDPALIIKNLEKTADTLFKKEEPKTTEIKSSWKLTPPH